MGSENSVLHEKDQNIANLEALVKKKEAEIGNLNEAITQRDVHIANLEATLNHIYNSHGWKALLVYYGLRNRVLPLHSRRRVFAKIVFNVIFDPGRFFTNLKKFVYYLEERPEKSVSALGFEDVSDGGERVTHLYPNDCYYAHLSIYNFALKYCKDKIVLDAGSGAGYGTAYLAERGARFVYGIDASSKAVAFSQYHFKRRNLKFQVMDLQKISGFPKNHFDFIFSSNTLEHIPDVSLFLRHVWKLLRADGVGVIAVPPIINEGLRKQDESNRYHLNIWSPRQWHYVLKQFFLEVELYRHHFEKSGIELNFANTPEQTIVTEEDFLFSPISLDHLYEAGSITALFVVKKPVPKQELPLSNSVISFIDDSYTRQPDSPVIAGNLSSPRTLGQLI
jgi:2-polyprenyl-3-methyl-5-hydroxy-6-metoxy-1,4-benzoquinol methylase